MSRWIIIANSSIAEIYSLDGREFTKVQQMDNPDGRLRSGEILQDRPGRGNEGKNSPGIGFGRHAYSSEIDPHVHEQQLFAHKIAEVLRRAKSANAFDKLDIIAPPQFLGELRKVLSEGVKLCIDKEINKEIPPEMNEREKQDAIRKFLDIRRPAAKLA